VAQFTIDIDNEHVQEVFAAFAFVYGYRSEIPNPVPQATVTDANGTVVPDPSYQTTIPNPQSVQAFARTVVIDFLKQVVDQARTQQAIAAAQAAAAAGGTVTIT
jgi:hypothetical protein